MGRLVRDGRAEPVSRGQIPRRENGDEGMIIFPAQLDTGRIGNSCLYSVLQHSISDYRTYRAIHIYKHVNMPPILLRLSYLSTCAPSLQNLDLVSYDCGRVFLTGVGVDSPLRYAIKCLSSRSSLSVETRRRLGWLKMVFVS